MSLLKPKSPFEKQLVKAIESAKPHLGVGILEKPLPGGSSLQPLPGRSRSSIDIHPFYILSSGLIHAGTINGLIPTYDGDPIGESGNAIELSGSFYVYARAVFSLTFGSHEFLATAALTGTPTIVTYATPLSDVLDPGDDIITYRLLAQVINGRVQRAQNTRNNLNVTVCDQSDGTSEGRAVGTTWTAAA